MSERLKGVWGRKRLSRTQTPHVLSIRFKLIIYVSVNNSHFDKRQEAIRIANDKENKVHLSHTIKSVLYLMSLYSFEDKPIEEYLSIYCT